MFISKHKLMIEQLDRKLTILKRLENISIPETGWIYSIRSAINMSRKQLGTKLGITPQSTKEIETREKSGSITIRNLNEVANALNMKVVYALIPKDKSLKIMIERAAHDAAKKIVLRTSNMMELEDQENTEIRLKRAIKEKSEEILQEMPKYLWD
jgi:predicted DNA-binding mobile mystery protein A